MRITLLWCALVIVGLTAGCGCGSKALVAGTLEDGTFWEKPLLAGSNSGGSYSKGSRVEVYEQFVVVTTPDGVSHVHPHGYYSRLQLKTH